MTGILGLRLKGFWFRVWGLGLYGFGLEFGVWGLGFRVQRSRFRVQGSEFRVYGLAHRGSSGIAPETNRTDFCDPASR